ncbi:hypothetical protein G7054_g1174 [Neopestalotiopsis clavispora]|nr:hypothetical protein G7054_g1174 [Neopestalotiopsis clavispora]
MYAPPPPRPKKTNIVRSRSGCVTCRKRQYSQPQQGLLSRDALLDSQQCALGNAGSTQDLPREEMKGLVATHLNATIHHETAINVTTYARKLYYLELWETQCLPALPSLFRLVASSTIMDMPPIIEDTVVALSACHLSRSLPEVKTKAGEAFQEFRPSAPHQAFGQVFYRNAIRRMVAWCPTLGAQDATIALSVMTLFGFLESMMGNFTAFDVHAKGIQELFQACHKSADKKEYLAQLYAVWVKCETYKWWLRFHFSTTQFQKTLEPFHLSLQYRHVLSDVENRRAIVSLLLCETYRLSNQHIIDIWESIQTDEDTQYPSLENSLSLAEHHGAEATLSGRCAARLALLQRQRQELEQWHSRLPISQIPIEPDLQRISLDVPDFGGHRVVPLQFTSHISAMNYAYYVAAMILQHQNFFEEMFANGPTSSETDSNEMESLILLLLRVVAGISWLDCVCLNTYSIGISNLLPICVLRSRNYAAGLWFQQWLEQRYHGGSLEEGSFPIAQCLGLITAINEYRNCGKDIIAFFSPEDDGGGAGKTASYASQMIESVLVYGKDRRTGFFFSEHVSIII